MKRINITTRNLLFLLVAALLNCLLSGIMNLIVTSLLCLILVPLAQRMDLESQKK